MIAKKMHTISAPEQGPPSSSPSRTIYPCLSSSPGVPPPYRREVRTETGRGTGSGPDYLCTTKHPQLRSRIAEVQSLLENVWGRINYIHVTLLIAQDNTAKLHSGVITK